MGSIDKRIVSLEFNAGDFSKGAEKATATLDKLKQSLKLENAAAGLNKVKSAAAGFNLGTIGTGIDALKAKFSTLGVAGITALTNITNKAVDAGLKLAKSLTIDPIMAGFSEYELKMGSIQTILANTARHGTTLDQVTASLDELNTYADKTIYNFGDMTKNIGLFTNAGIKVEDATSMIKGFSNEAAASGTTSAAASNAAFQLSQALSAGQIRLMDWRSLTNAGMGNKNMQNGLLDIAKAMGTLTATGTDASAVQKDFNSTLEKGWLTADVMQSYLQIQAGDLTDAQMKAIGLSGEQIENFKKQAKTAEEAATKVRTWTQLIGTLGEAVGSGWSQTFEVLIGGFDEATTLFSGISDKLGGFIEGISKARNELLQGWSDLGGRTALIQGFANIFKFLGDILGPIPAAFREVFKPIQPSTLAAATKEFERFTASLSALKPIGDILGTAFTIIFSGIKILLVPLKLMGTLLSSVLQGVLRLFAGATAGSGDFLKSIEKIVVGFADFITSADFMNQAVGFIQRNMERFFDVAVKVADWGRSNILGPVSKGFGYLASLLPPLWDYLVKTYNAARDFVKSLDFGGAGRGALGFIQSISDYFKQLGQNASDAGGSIKDRFVGVLDSIKTKADQFLNFLKGINDAILEVFPSLGRLGDALKTTFGGSFNFGNLLAVGAGGGLMVLVAKLKKMKEEVVDGTLEKIKGILDGITGALKGMQQNLQASALLKIALAIGVLALSLGLIAMIDQGKMTTATVAITVLFANLAAAMKTMTKVFDPKATAQVIALAGAMVIVSVAILLLATALKKLSSISGPDLLRAIVALSFLTGVIVVLSKALSKSSATIVKGAGAVVVFAVGILMLVAAMFGIASALVKFSGVVQTFAEIPLNDLVKGLLAMTAVLGILVATFKLIPDSSAMNSAAILILAFAMRYLADVIQVFAKLPIGEIIKGAAGMALVLALVGAAMMAIPKTAIASALAVVIVAAALEVLAHVLGIFGSMPLGNIGKALLVLVVSLLAVAAAMYAMTSALPGAAALLIVSVALGMLAPVLMMFSKMDLNAIGMSLLMLVGVFAAVAVGGLLLYPVVPALLAFGGALVLVGAAIFIAAAGFSLFAAAMATLGVVGAAGTTALTLALTALSAVLPALGHAFGMFIVNMVQAIGNGIPQVVDALGQILIAIFQALEDAVPSLQSLIETLLDAVIAILRKYIPILGDAAVEVLIALLTTIRDNIYQVTDLVLDIITEFVDALAANLDPVIQAAVNLVVQLVNGVANTIRDQSGPLGEAGANLVSAIVDGIINAIGSFATTLWNSAKAMADELVKGFKEFLGIHSPSQVFMDLAINIPLGIINGIANGIGSVVSKGVELARGLVDGVKNFFAGSTDTAKNFINGLITSIGNGVTSVVNKAKSLGTNVVNGIKSWFASISNTSAGNFIKGTITSIGNGVNSVVDKAKNLGSRVVSGIKSWFGSNSNSTAGNFIKGTITSIGNGINSVVEKGKSLARQTIQGVKDWFSGNGGTPGSTLVSKLASGIRNSVSNITGAAQNLAGKAIQGVKDWFSGNASSAAGNLISGLANGIRNGASRAINAARNMASDMLSAAKNALGIQSPSKRFAEVGAYSVEGLVEGIKKLSPKANQAAEEMGNDTLAIVRDRFAEIVGALEEDPEFNPRIVPVVDMSAVNAAGSAVSGYFNDPSILARTTGLAQKSFDLVSANGSAAAPVVSGGVTVNMEQKNYSPEALSPAEIYRQTNNLLHKFGSDIASINK